MSSDSIYDHVFSLYEKIKSMNARASKEGLSELKHVLITAKDLELNDKGYLKMFEVIFSVVSRDKAAYARNPKKADALTVGASALRAAVEHGVKIFKGKSVKALIQHITSTLPHSRGGLCSPISMDYIRSLRTVLEHAPHIEHLPPKEWLELVKFCCRVLQTDLAPLNDNSEVESVHGEKPKGRQTRAGSYPALSRESSSLSKASLVVANPRLRSETEELMYCLQLLLQIPNAPIMFPEESIEEIVGNTIMEFLQSQATLTTAHVAAFSSLNSILATVSTNNIKMARKIAQGIPKLVARIWESKSGPFLKEQIIICLIYSLPHLRAYASDLKADHDEVSLESIRGDLNDLLSSLVSEYTAGSGRITREQLQLDEIEFPNPNSIQFITSPLTLSTFSLRAEDSRKSEQPWMILHIIAVIVLLLDIGLSENISVDVMDSEDSEIENRSKRRRKNKRRKVERKFDQILQQASSASLKTKLVALHLIPFLLEERRKNHECPLDAPEWVRIMADLSLIASEDNTACSSWAMLGIASGAFLPPATLTQHSTFWEQTWKLCSRQISNQTTCRAACHLMRVILSRNLINYSAISKSVDNMLLSMDLNGPPVLVDSALDLWNLIINRRNAVAHSLLVQPEERLIRWFVGRWRPVDGLERTNTVAIQLHSGRIVQFLLMCLGEKGQFLRSPISLSCGPIARAWLKNTHESKLLNYLLLEGDEAVEHHDNSGQLLQQASTPLASECRRNVNAIVSDFLDREAGNMDERWQTIVAANVKNISPWVLQNYAAFLFIAGAVLTSGEQEFRNFDPLIEKLGSIENHLVSYIGRPDCTEAHLNAVLDCLAPLIPDAERILSSGLGPHKIFEGTLGKTLSSISAAIDSSIQARTEMHEDDDVDMEDFDMPVRRGPGVGAKDLKTVPREALQAIYSLDAIRNSTLAVLNLLPRVQKKDLNDLSHGFCNFIMRLPLPRLLLIKPVLHQFLRASTAVDANDASELLEYLAREILQNYELSMCETSMDFILDTVKALISRWVPPGSDAALKDLCESIYTWLTDVCLESNRSSVAIRMEMAVTLLHILEIDKSYKSGDKSARTHFIFLLKDTDIRVKLLMAEIVPRLFEIYPLNQHLSLYKDIHGCLHREVQWLEGLAMRCYTLSCLATASHSTKRRAVYYMFETASVEGVERYAAKCIASVAKALGLENAQSLFRIYSSQLLFTWISSHGLDSLPFRVCGYSSREDLFIDMKEELVAQLFMQDLDDDVEVLAKMIGTTYENLISLAFHRIIAYGTAWAIQTPRQEGAPKLPSVDSRVRRRLGEATYNGLYEQYFPLVVATLFQTIEQDGTSDKLLSRDASLASAKVVMDDIVSIAVSDTPDPEPLKPSFKVKVVLNALHHICHRWGYDETKLWSPPIFTFVARKLFDTIDRGLGPLHTCAVIRKIRLLVCLAGKTVHEGYPLEMLIHGLKPFIVNTFCAQDTVGIVQYLFINGKTYLQTNPTFVVSTFLSIMSSLRAFIATTPDSQVESSQFRSSQSTAQSFHSWLCDYLSDYHSTAMNNANAETFKALVDCAIGFKSNGNAFKGTKEGELLQVLLMDESNENGLLDDVSKHVAFSLISSNFTRPESYREDMLGADRDSISVSKSLLRTCRSYNVSDDYLLWCARALGRAYAASGTIYSEWTQEAELAKETDLPNNSNTLAIIPKAAILKHLTGFLFSGDRRKVGLAEITLIDIFHQEKNADKDRTLISDLVVSMHLLKALGWDTPPQNPPPVPNVLKISEAGKVGNSQVQDWIRNFAIAISLNTADAVGNRVAPLLQSVDGLAEKLFPYLVHIMLILEGDDDNSELRQSLSAVFRKCFRDRRTFSVPHMAILIKTILYLRTQAREGEKTKLARDDWLDLDYQDLAKAACICRMYKTALMLVEIHCSRKKTDFNECAELLLEIYTNIDDPDSFYGLSRGASLGTVISKLEYEQDGWKCLSFRGAQMESSLRLRSEFNNIASIGAINALNILGLNGLSHSFLQGGILGFGDEGTSENGYESAWKLEQWNLPCPVAYNGRAPIVYRALQSINNTVSTQNFQAQLDTSFLDVMKQITSGKQTSRSLRANIRTLAMLTEVEEVLSSENSVQLQEVWGRLERRIPWMKIANFSEVEEILSIRQVTFSSIAKRQHLQDKIQIDLRAARMYQAKALSSVCELARIHKVHQHALSACTHLSDIVAPCQEIGLDISAVAALQTANVLWDQGEILTSIRVLQELDNAKSDMITQDISIGRTELLATLGCWISEARLEKPELIMAQYLERSIRELTKERPKCEVAGRVFHEFAVFCDRQLSNQNNIEDYERASKLRENKHAEILEAERQMKSASGSKLEQLKSFRGKAKQLLNLDELEYIRLRENREAFLEKSIGNYLRCLEVCDDYDQDAIRFCSLWLQYSTNEKANRAASLTLNKVPSRKFVSLMNQLSSRMLDQKDDFQELLLPLILRICRDHPYHGIYQILSVTKSKSKDHLSHSRATMASTVAMTLKKENKFAGQTMNKIYAAISTYIKVAAYKMDKKSSKIPIRKAFPEEPTLASKIEREIPSLKLPPPTMNIEIRADCDYTNLPYLQKFNPELSVASSGVSAPKILTCHDSSGQSYKMLVKGGNDDLRQDAIMEQVFEQVSHLLQRNRQARQRNLGIRTYKVLPLSVQTGIIEFVPNTIPLHEYLIPAHQAYHPKEWTASKCRSTITSVQEQSREMRVEAFLKVMRNYSPVMRYFFMHQFDGPDEWFRSRLAYTRSTAAISILGYVLGLGDRHGHNILLDEKSGEVVHIDLGVAFEQGRVLPIPEVVPFRLTRDIVDGMGVTGTEGVFRRCCEFTLSVLRIEKDNITTILDVLRYDPLYSWTISPIKMQRMQQGNFELEVKKEDPDIDLFAKPNAGNKQEAEAERALEIVNKKLSQALSVSATVNELIQQASDVKNLAVLFGGWAAYA